MRLPIVILGLLLLALAWLTLVRGAEPPLEGAFSGMAFAPEPAAVVDVAQYEAAHGAGGEPQSRTPLPELAPDGGDSAAPAADPEWQALPVTTFSFPRSLVSAPHPIDVRWLFRNTTLNPHDRYLPLAVRSDMRQRFGAKKQTCVQCARAIAEVARRELADLIASGRVAPVLYADYVARLGVGARQEHERRVAEEAEKIRRAAPNEGLEDAAVAERIARIRVFDPRLGHGFEPFASRQVGDAYYACRLADMPRARAAVAVWREALLDCVRSIGYVLREAGALDEAGVDALVHRVETAAAARYSL